MRNASIRQDRVSYIYTQFKDDDDDDDDDDVQ